MLKCMVIVEGLYPIHCLGPGGQAANRDPGMECFFSSSKKEHGLDGKLEETFVGTNRKISSSRV